MFYYSPFLSTISPKTCQLHVGCSQTTLSSSQKFEELDRTKLQTDLDRISEWCKRWHMSLNTAKCKIMNVRRTNTESVYTIEDTLGNRSRLAPTSNERDLGIMISRDLKPNDHVCKEASMLNKVLGILKSTFVSRDAGLWK